MKKHPFSLLICLTTAFLCFTFGFFLGRNSVHGEITVSVPPSMTTMPTQTAPLSRNLESVSPEGPFPIDINTATVDALTALPGIGQTYAQRIVDYRKENGPFSSVEELLNVQGIGHKRLEDIIDLITIGG